MPRSALWQEIAETLAAEIARGHFPMGGKLPTEAELSARFGVNRHTVRHALAELAGRGLTHARRGAGVFVTGRTTDYPLGKRVRFHRAIEAAGQVPSRRVTRNETRPSDGEEAAALGLPLGEAVHVVEGVSMADGQPIAWFRSVFPAERFPALPGAMARQGSVTAALAECGLADYTRARTRLNAVAAPATMAATLRLPPGAPVLRSVAVNHDGAGRPVEFGMTWFAGERVTLTVEGG